MLLVVVVLFTEGRVAVGAFALLGLSNAVMWPAIWPLAINGLGRFTKTGSALLVMGIAGGALIPPLYGKIAEVIHSLQNSYFIMLPCYIYILYFATKGYKAGLKESQL
jgi:fucose permease